MSIRCCEYVTKINNKNDLESIKSVLRKHENCIDKYALIIHDKDVYTETDAPSEEMIGKLKDSHIHLLMHYNVPQQIKYVAKWFDSPENFINKIKGRFVDAIKYLIHMNAPDKYQYSQDEVYANFDIAEYITQSDTKKNIDVIIERILAGDIAEYNKTRMINQTLLIRYAKRIDEAFKVRSEYLAVTQKERNMECVYITGEAGTGKTTYAKKLAESKGLEYYISSSCNDVLDGYRQEPCIILDDIRKSELTLSDLLKLLDNNTASSVRSRYKNKYVRAELIILTTVLSIEEFHNMIYHGTEEPIAQLKRRCRTHIRMNLDNIFFSVYNPETLDYTEEIAYNNTVIPDISKKSITSIDEIKSNITQYVLPELKEDNFIQITSNNPFADKK